ncbi:hypothetical protein D3C78_1157720 [compost metagenome]
MLIETQNLCGAQHDAGAEQVPLNLQPAIGAVAKAVTHQGIAAADHTGQKQRHLRQPCGNVVQPVNQSHPYRQGSIGRS